MTGYFGTDLFYCEYYSLADCCKSVPCRRRGGHRFVYQKSHDRDFQLPGDIEDALYLVQYRHPVPEALSDRALELQNTADLPNFAFRCTRAGYAVWLAGKALYYARFHDKWMARKMPNAIYLDYCALAASPEALMKNIISRMGAELDERRLSDSVGRVSAQPIKPHEISDSPYFDTELLGAFEAWVVAHCPMYKFSRQLTGSYEESEIYALILLKDQSQPLPEGQTDRLASAARIAPDHPEIQRRLALRTIRKGHTAAGIERLKTLLERHPFYAAGYDLLLSACADSGVPVPDSVLNGNALVACSQSAKLSMQLGAAFEEKGHWMNANAAYSLANALAPADKQVSERLAAATTIGKR